ncbi:MAG: 6-bladed beta-propeller [Deltaproteobacteria bacterium]|nr:6-bladed beta-propeller [Deltaproteobacteria bacterium]
MKWVMNMPGALPPLLVLVGVLVIAPGCATPGPLIVNGANLRWPKAPAPARIRYVGQILGGTSRSAVAEVIAGRAEARVDLVRPYAVTTTSGGVVVVTDPGRGHMNLFDLRRRTHRVISAYRKTALVSPVGVASDAKGLIYVADSVLHDVFVFDAAGKAIRSFGGKFRRPTGMTIDRARGVVYVADTLAHEVRALTTEGKALFTIGKRGSGPGEFNYPTHLAFNQKAGTLLVCDTLNFRIQRFDRKGTPLGMFGKLGDSSGALAKPKGIAVDSAGHIYVTDAIFDVIQVFDAEGHLLLYFGKPGKGKARLAMPTGLAIDERDYLYVANTLNRRVEVFQYLGKVIP